MKHFKKRKNLHMQPALKNRKSNQPYCSHIKREKKDNFLRNFFALRWLFTPRVPQFISLRHNMAIEIFYEIAYMDRLSCISS